ncbi:MAG: peptidoglycan DD-metalloendopeptidase family protein [Candidatus Dojkabacteria bacterium]|nr:MAG: peptidoglycan DD-metalloendopeptidase family protein [Candidatus Dojkabacteria bacterium]
MMLLILLLLFLAVPGVHAESQTISYPLEAITYIESGFPTTPTWNTRNLFLGYDIIYSKGRNKILFKGQFQQLKELGLTSDDIQSTVINLTQYQNQGTNTHIDIAIGLPQESWDYKTVTWNTKPHIQASTTQLLPLSLGTKSVDITIPFIAGYQSFLSSGDDRGLQISFVNEIHYASVFWSPGCEIAPAPPICNPGEFPSITVTLTEGASLIQSPVLIEEPPITGGKTNTLYWEGNNECEEYQVQWANNLSFVSAGEPSWVKERETTITLSAGTYYFRVRCRVSDKYSAWSNITQSKQDPQFPFMEYFKTSKTIAAPFEKDGAIEGEFYIQGRCGGSIKSLTIYVQDKQGNVVFTQTETQKVYLWTYWPDTVNAIVDGTYSVFMKCEAQSGDMFLAPPLVVTVDTSPPTQPRITVLSDNKRKKEILVHCNESIPGKAYLSNKIISEFQESTRLILDLNDGSFTLKAACTDSAGHKAENSIILTVDTTPPSKPSVKFNDAQDPTEFISSCKEGGKVKISADGEVLYEGNCPTEESFIFSLNDKALQSNYMGSSISDAYDNWSDLAVKPLPIKKPASTEFMATTVNCKTEIDLRKEQNQYTSCDWSTVENIFKALEAEKISDTEAIHTIEAPRNITIMLNVTTYSCMNKTFWNPLTWFGCSEVIEKQSFTDIPVLLSISAPNTLMFDRYSTDKRLYTILLPINDKSLKIEYQVIAGKLLTIHNQQIDITITSPLTTEIALQEPTVPKNIPPLGWIFKNLVQVSQWYGMTAYQKPHTGIDFSVAQADILAPDDATVVTKGYHQSTACFGGGYYIGIKHNSGTYSFYFHLENAPAFAIGTKVKRGQIIAKSGKSGLYNCQKLAYHLHFEIRTSQQLKDHLDPVPFINVDWNQIKTAKANVYPGRLTGNNPHPSY